MSVWRPQQYIKAAKRAGVKPVVRRRAAKTASKTARVNPDLHPLLTLRHLAHLTRVNYGFLRAVVTRKNTDPYRVFAIKKSRSEPKQSAYRIICVPYSIKKEGTPASFRLKTARETISRLKANRRHSQHRIYMLYN